MLGCAATALRGIITAAAAVILLTCAVGADDKGGPMALIGKK